MRRSGILVGLATVAALWSAASGAVAVRAATPTAVTDVGIVPDALRISAGPWSVAPAAGALLAGTLATATVSGIPTPHDAPPADAVARIDPVPAEVAGPTVSAPGPASREPSLRMRATYDVDTDVSWSTRVVHVDTRIDIVNTSGGPASRIVLNTVAAKIGSMHLGSVVVDGKPVSVTIRDQSILVPLRPAQPAGASFTVRVKYRGRVGLSTAGHSWMWAKQNNVMNLYRFIPWLSRAVPFNRDNHGDPFVLPTSPEVRVRLTSDRRLTWATSGERASADGRTQTFVARNVRDFNATASPDYKVTSARTADGETLVRVYTIHGRADLLMASTLRAMKQFEAWVGPYPWPVYNVAESAGGFAMESPALIWMPMTEFTDADVRYITAHETAHQWFYGAVGNDQTTDMFADEAMSDFLSRKLVHRMRGSLCSKDRFDKSLYQYSGSCYFEIIYVQGSRWIDDLRRTMGDGPFWSTVRRYYRDNLFTISSDKTLLEAWRDTAGDRLVARYRVRFPSIYPK
jgi:hypothetical protein